MGYFCKIFSYQTFIQNRPIWSHCIYYYPSFHLFFFIQNPFSLSFFLPRNLLPFSLLDSFLSVRPQSLSLHLHQCDQIGQFIGLWATFQSLWQQLVYPNLPYCKGIKFFNFSSKKTFSRHLVTYYWSHWFSHIKGLASRSLQPIITTKRQKTEEEVSFSKDKQLREREKERERERESVCVWERKSGD